MCARGRSARAKARSSGSTDARGMARVSAVRVSAVRVSAVRVSAVRVSAVRVSAVRVSGGRGGGRGGGRIGGDWGDAANRGYGCGWHRRAHVLLGTTLGLRIGRPQARVANRRTARWRLAIRGNLYAVERPGVEHHLALTRREGIYGDVLAAQRGRVHATVEEPLGAVAHVILRAVALRTSDGASVAEPVACHPAPRGTRARAAGIRSVVCDRGRAASPEALVCALTRCSHSARPSYHCARKWDRRPRSSLSRNKSECGHRGNSNLTTAGHCRPAPVVGVEKRAPRGLRPCIGLGGGRRRNIRLASGRLRKRAFHS